MHSDLNTSLAIVGEIMAMPGTPRESAYRSGFVLDNPDLAAPKLKALLESFSDIPPHDIDELAASQIKEYFQDAPILATFDEVTNYVEPLSVPAAVVVLAGIIIARYTVKVDYQWPAWREFMSKYGNTIMQS